MMKWPARTQAGEAYETEAARANLRLVLFEAILWLRKYTAGRPVGGLAKRRVSSIALFS